MDNLSKDPVCGLHIDRSGLVSFYKGKMYFFCSIKCKIQFDENPERHLNKKKAATDQA